MVDRRGSNLLCSYAKRRPNRITVLEYRERFFTRIRPSVWPCPRDWRQPDAVGANKLSYVCGRAACLARP
jgi:hypothetical protein